VARPAIQVAEVFRRHGEAYREANAGHLDRCQSRVMAAIEACRTAALGGHVTRCTKCALTEISYCSCIMGKIGNGESAPGAVRFRPNSVILLPLSDCLQCSSNDTARSLSIARSC